MFKKTILVFSFLSLIIPSAFADNSNFYVRADGGMSFLTGKTKNLRNLEGKEGKFHYKASPVLSIGVGYVFNPNVRSDIILSYITSHKLKQQTLNNQRPSRFGDKINGKISSQSVMLNGYYDFTPEYSFTPYVTAGAGMAFNHLKNFTRSHVHSNGDFFLENFKGKISRQLVWKVGMGSSSALTENTKFDVAYNYISLGKVEIKKNATTASLFRNSNSVSQNINLKNFPELKNIHSHQITLGLRYSF